MSATGLDVFVERSYAHAMDVVLWSFVLFALTLFEVWRAVGYRLPLAIPGSYWQRYSYLIPLNKSATAVWLLSAFYASVLLSFAATYTFLFWSAARLSAYLATSSLPVPISTEGGSRFVIGGVAVVVVYVGTSHLITRAVANSSGDGMVEGRGTRAISQLLLRFSSVLFGRYLIWVTALEHAQIERLISCFPADADMNSIVAGASRRISDLKSDSMNEKLRRLISVFGYQATFMLLGQEFERRTFEGKRHHVRLKSTLPVEFLSGGHGIIRDISLDGTISVEVDTYLASRFLEGDEVVVGFGTRPKARISNPASCIVSRVQRTPEGAIVILAPTIGKTLPHSILNSVLADRSAVLIAENAGAGQGGAQ